MDMGVKLEGATPGVEDAKEAGEITADVVFVEGEFFDGLRGGLEQGRVSHLLVFSDEAAQAFRDSKREHEMMTWELAFEMFVQPLPALLVLTCGTMAISTGAMDAMNLSARLALIEGDPTGLGATGDDGIDDLSVCMGHELGIALQVLWAESSKDLIDGGHGLGPPLPD
jgi:hypothetical protein